jgi:hypothetical protein
MIFGLSKRHSLVKSALRAELSIAQSLPVQS